MVKFTKALCILLLALKSRPLNHASSCDWYIENSLKTKSISGNCLQTLTDYSDCCFALSNSDWPLNPAPNTSFALKGFGTVRPDSSDFSGFQIAFNISPKPKPKCSSFPVSPSVSGRGPLQPLPPPHPPRLAPPSGLTSSHHSSSSFSCWSRIFEQSSLKIQS